MNERILYGVGGLVIGLAVGGVVTYFATKKRLKNHYEDIADSEIESVKQYYRNSWGHREKPHPAWMAERIMEDEGYAPGESPASNFVINQNFLSSEEPDVSRLFSMDTRGDVIEDDEDKGDSGPTVYDLEDDPGELYEIDGDDLVSKNVYEIDGDDLVSKNVFDTEQPEFTKEDEVRTVIDHDNPYIISYDEYFDSDEVFTKMSATYYEGDDIFCDDRDQIIPEFDKFVGTDAPTRFGHRSGDKNIVYVRNEKLELDFEIKRDPRSFTNAVLKINDGEDNSPRKMRDRE